MQKKTSIPVALAAVLTIGGLGYSSTAPAQYRVITDRVVDGFAFPESVGCDLHESVLYVSNFGSATLDSTARDGAGYISKLALDGKVIEQRFLPAAEGERLNKPKGIWVQGERLWVTDIDAVWVFDLKTRRGRKAALPGIQFANDAAVTGGALYVSDNRSDQLFRVEPADFLDSDNGPQVKSLFRDAGVNPNGLYPAGDGTLLMAGFSTPEVPRGIFALDPNGRIREVSAPLGRLDGIYRLADGSILATDWDTGSLFHWTDGAEMQKLAVGFKGPADFCVVPEAEGMTVVVPDLVQSRLRLLQLGK